MKYPPIACWAARPFSHICRGGVLPTVHGSPFRTLLPVKATPFPDGKHDDAPEHAFTHIHKQLYHHGTPLWKTDKKIQESDIVFTERTIS